MEFKMDIERELAYAVVDAFEDLLDEKNIEIPCADHFEEEERHHEGNDAKIYGTEYCDLIMKVMDVLKGRVK